MVSPGKMLTGVSKTSDRQISISESETDKPFSHFEIVCRTTFNLLASSACERPFYFLSVLIFLLNIDTNRL